MKTMFLVAMIAAPGAAAPAQSAAGKNVLDVVVVGGPFAGTYHRVDVICMHAQRQRVFSAAYKDFNPTGARSFLEGGVEVRDPDVAGAKRATVSLSFGDPANPTTLQISHEPVSFAMQPGGASIAFEGKTDSGVRIKLTAACYDVTTV